MDYMDLMSDFFTKNSRLASATEDKDIIEILLDNKSLIREISNNTKQTKIFKYAKDDWLKKLETVSRLKNQEEQIISVYDELLNKMISAPTALHLEGTIVLLMPVLDEVLSGLNKEEVLKKLEATC